MNEGFPRLWLPVGAEPGWGTCHVHARVVGIGSKQVDSQGSGSCRVEGDRREEGQRVVPGRGVENAVNLKLFHHHHSWVMRKNVKASENAKHPKGRVKRHKFWVLGEIKLNFRCKMIVLLSEMQRRGRLVRKLSNRSGQYLQNLFSRACWCEYLKLLHIN